MPLYVKLLNIFNFKFHQNWLKKDVISFALVQTNSAPSPESDVATAVHHHHKLYYITI